MTDAEKLAQMRLLVTYYADAPDLEIMNDLPRILNGEQIMSFANNQDGTFNRALRIAELGPMPT